MANEENVRIEFTDEELAEPRQDYRAAPAYFNSPEAVVRTILGNYGIRTIVPDEFLKNDPRYDGSRTFLRTGHPAIPRYEYENTLADAQMAFEGDADFAESINDLLKASQKYAKKQKRYPKPLTEKQFKAMVEEYGK